MKILAFESSCDETAVAVVEDGRNVLTDQIFSQADLHAIYGGVVPEIASRSHVEVISRLAERAVQAAGIEKSDIDARCGNVRSRPYRNGARRPQLCKGSCHEPRRSAYPRAPYKGARCGKLHSISRA